MIRSVRTIAIIKEWLDGLLQIDGIIQSKGSFHTAIVINGREQVHDEKVMRRS